ncbi:integrase catalytic domain-containing protein [Trichonephila inaurata madagascariensis]|uniref:Integrase catalytic domain-containing protein n=1 Tax=Trichonephila inaurata madagascariensis TaxID=2747483 RepID=A0A8X7BRN7_9ARAC|nr:integrase catalytic domain-containing protein [Trichonephila inaurata madagascariensis]
MDSDGRYVVSLPMDTRPSSLTHVAFGADSLTIDLRDCVEDDTPVTKRKGILSTVHKIFDPLGFTCPVTLGPKVLLQECWKLKVSWDTELPPPLVKNLKDGEKNFV